MHLTTVTAITNINRYNIEQIVAILHDNGYTSYGMTLDQLQQLGYVIDYVSVYPTDKEYLLMSKPMPVKHNNLITGSDFIAKYGKRTFKTAYNNRASRQGSTPQQDYDQHEMEAIRRDYDVVAIVGTGEMLINGFKGK